MAIIIALLVAGLIFYAGVLYGVYQTKRDYEIGVGVTPEDYEEMFNDLYAKAYGTYHEVE